jgi:hypothetical protein
LCLEGFENRVNSIKAKEVTLVTKTEFLIGQKNPNIKYRVTKTRINIFEFNTPVFTGMVVIFISLSVSLSLISNIIQSAAINKNCEIM